MKVLYFRQAACLLYTGRENMVHIRSAINRTTQIHLQKLEYNNTLLKDKEYFCIDRLKTDIEQSSSN